MTDRNPTYHVTYRARSGYWHKGKHHGHKATFDVSAVYGEEGLDLVATIANARKAMAKKNVASGTEWTLHRSTEIGKGTT